MMIKWIDYELIYLRKLPKHLKKILPSKAWSKAPKKDKEFISTSVYRDNLSKYSRKTTKIFP